MWSRSRIIQTQESLVLYNSLLSDKLSIILLANEGVAANNDGEQHGRGLGGQANHKAKQRIQLTNHRVGTRLTVKKQKAEQEIDRLQYITAVKQANHKAGYKVTNTGQSQVWTENI